MLESRRQKKVIDYLHSIGAWTCKVLQANKNGVPDVIACVPMTLEEVEQHMKRTGKTKIGVFVAPEIKQPNGKTSPLQKRNIKQINYAGGISGSDITSVEDMKDLLDN